MKMFSVLALALVAGTMCGVHADTTMKRSLNVNENDPNAAELGNVHNYIAELKEELAKANLLNSNSHARRLRANDNNDPTAAELGNVHNYIAELKEELAKANLLNNNGNVVAMESQREFAKKTNAPDAAGW